MAPLLGWIAPKDRNQAQQDAHAKAMAIMPKFALPPVTLVKGQKIILSQTWKDPRVVADVGFEFNGFRQLTGACVGVSNGISIFTVGSVQRCIADNPTKAFLPFWGFNYGRTRYLEGDRGQGEGAVDSVCGTQDTKEGTIEASEPGLPQFDHSDGLALTKKQELQWSDGGSSLVTQYIPKAQTHLMGARTPLYSTAEIVTSIANGYPVLTGCDMYVGTGHIKGSGADAYVVGKHDGQGGHSTGFLGVWLHPTDGLLLLYSNQWDGNTYPTDPAGGGRCMVWIPESESDRRFSMGGGDGESMALSHLASFPVQVDRIMNLMDA